MGIAHSHSAVHCKHRKPSLLAALTFTHAVRACATLLESLNGDQVSLASTQPSQTNNGHWPPSRGAGGRGGGQWAYKRRRLCRLLPLGGNGGAYRVVEDPTGQRALLVVVGHKG